MTDKDIRRLYLAAKALLLAVAAGIWLAADTLAKRLER